MSFRLEKTIAGVDIVIDGFEKGIAQSPYQGIADMRNVDPVTIPLEASVAQKVSAMQTQLPIAGVAFTVDDSTDIFTYNGVVPLKVGTAILVTNSGGALPTGMSAGTPYYVKTIPTSTTFTLSANAGGTTLNVSSAGTGTNTFTTINIGTPKFILNTSIVSTVVANLSSNRLYFMLDSNGRCWILNNAVFDDTDVWIYMNNLSSESSLGTGNGLSAWKNWVFVWESSTLRVIPLVNALVSTLIFLTTKASWTEWKDLNDIFSLGLSTTSHYALIGQDDAVYFCNGYGVGSILEVEGEIFTPNTGRVLLDGATTDNDKTVTSATGAFTIRDVGSAISGAGIPDGAVIASINSSTSIEISEDATATATGVDLTIPQSNTFNNTALAIPTSDQAICLGELGINLLVGGINNFIYPWNRTATSYTFPIFLSENYVSRIVTINTTAYIFCGRRGRIYQTNGANANFFYKIPDFLSNTVNPTFIWADANFSRNQLYFGFQVKTNAGVVVAEYGGLWVIDTITEGGWLLNKLSYGTYAGYVSAIAQYIGDTKSVTSSGGVFGNDTGYGLLLGWNDGSIGGMDKSVSTPYTGGESYIDSDMIPVGTFLTKQTYQNVEFKLTTPLVTGESVALYYRTSITGAYTLLPLTAGGAVGDISGYANVNFEQIQWLQIRAVLTGTASSPSYVRLKEIRIR